MKQRYDSYKLSGIDWIGEIPSHWEIRKTSHLFIGIGSGTTPTSGSSRYYAEVGINWLQTGDLNDGIINDTSKKITEVAISDYSSLKSYPKGSIVIAMYGATIGKLGKLNIETTTNQACCVLPQSLSINQDFAFYAYYAGKKSLINSAYGGGQPNISQETIKSFRIPLPSLAEQEAIAAWLDVKCGEIDAAIAKVEREIELIDELKQSEISRVVTRGLNPDVPLRPSGIDWIGDVPEHWTITPFKRSMTINNGCDYKHVVAEDGYPVIGSGGQFAFASEYLYDGEVLLLGRKGTIDRPMYYRGKFWTVDTMFYAVPKEEVCCRYMYYQALGFPFDYYSTATALPSMAASDLANNPIVVPPLSEQREIADYLDRKCAEIDGLKDKLKRKRETLVELRQSLISEVVTGKRKVV